MKQRDIAVIVAIALVSGIFSYVLANVVLGGSKAYKLTAPSVDAISADFNQPNTKYFNRQSIDPTVNIIIGDSSNINPLKTTKTP